MGRVDKSSYLYEGRIEGAIKWNTGKKNILKIEKGEILKRNKIHLLVKKRVLHDICHITLKLVVRIFRERLEGKRRRHWQT